MQEKIIDHAVYQMRDLRSPWIWCFLGRASWVTVHYEWGSPPYPIKYEMCCRCSRMSCSIKRRTGERLHATVGDMLRATLNSEPPIDVPAALDLIDSILASAQFAPRAAMHTTLGILPGPLVFQCDMVWLIPLIANYQQFHARRQARIDENSQFPGSTATFLRWLEILDASTPPGSVACHLGMMTTLLAS
jgi:hypothetical protein